MPPFPIPAMALPIIIWMAAFEPEAAPVIICPIS